MEEIQMNKIKHAAAKKVFSGVADYAVSQVHKILRQLMKN